MRRRWTTGLQHFKVTPDPGVIEVNLQPSANWQELVGNTTTLYDEARRSRLGTEKFMLDGRHTGTGGGNHIVLGGAAPTTARSSGGPIFCAVSLPIGTTGRRSRTCFPGCSSGRRARPRGPTRPGTKASTSWRRPSARCPKPHMPPWIVDRLFRNLLTDLTGNTHRAEFCIDKLYSPDSADRPAGAGGIPQLRDAAARADEPHAAIAGPRPWSPASGKSRTVSRWSAGARRCTTASCCRTSSCRIFWRSSANCASWGLRFVEPDWFAPHFEFRFPRLGEAAYDGVKIELRQAIEPWHVLGEEASTGGTARYVDSSVERLQVKVRGMTERRHVVACNGRRVPLHPTGTRGEFVAGVRYRAWQPPSCLHPTIGVHTPLVFDVYDAWSNRSIGGCTWHVIASGRPALRDVSGKCGGGRKPPRCAVCPGPHARLHAAAQGRAQPGLSHDARPPPPDERGGVGGNGVGAGMKAYCSPRLPGEGPGVRVIALLHRLRVFARGAVC